MRTPTEIVSEALREEDVLPTVGALREDLKEVDSIIGHLDKEIQILQDRIGPILLSEDIKEPPSGGDKPRIEVPESRRCGLSADLKGLREQAWALQSRLRILTNWVSTVTSEVRL